MSEKSFNIDVKFHGDLEKGKAAASVLNDLKDGTQKLADPTEEASKKFKLFEGHGKEVKKSSTN
jgi:hypothetical protein